jgi:KaiC/GvpD/RAD55 family RecA-like ATPase
MTHTEDDGLAAVLERVQTGVEAFDELVMGGLPRGRATVVGGTPGSGKTVFATQFLANGIAQFNESGVFVTFEESPKEIEANMAGFGWDIARWVREKRLAFVDASPRADDEIVIGEFDLAALLVRILHAAETVRAKRVVLDSLAQRRRTIEVLKMRGSHHVEGEAPFTLVGGRGIVAVPLSSLRLEQESSTKRVTSGNHSIDDMCGWFLPGQRHAGERRDRHREDFAGHQLSSRRGRGGRESAADGIRRKPGSVVPQRARVGRRLREDGERGPA